MILLTDYLRNSLPKVMPSLLQGLDDVIAGVEFTHHASGVGNINEWVDHYTCPEVFNAINGAMLSAELRGLVPPSTEEISRNSHAINELVRTLMTSFCLKEIPKMEGWEACDAAEAARCNVPFTLLVKKKYGIKFWELRAGYSTDELKKIQKDFYTFRIHWLNYVKDFCLRNSHETI